MSNHLYSEAENKIWLANLPKKSVGVKIIIKSNKGNILLVKPNYKKTWQFPGGGVESKEDPKNAVIREVHEETGLKIDILDLRLLDTLFWSDYDNLVLIYEYAHLINENDKLTIPADELEGYQFCEVRDIKSFVGSYYENFLNLYLKD